MAEYARVTTVARDTHYYITTLLFDFMQILTLNSLHLLGIYPFDLI